MQDKAIKLAVIGSRSFDDKNRLFAMLDKNIDRIEMIVSGGAKGADSLAHQWAQERGVPCLIFYARWHSLDGDYDRGAGFKRNHKIIDTADRVLAFWDGESRGTAHSMSIAKHKNKPIKVITFSPQPKEVNESESNKTFSL